MTTPKVATIKRGDSRFYVHPETAEKVPGVTSVVAMLPKPFLKFWAAREAATFAVDNFHALQALAANDREATIEVIKRAPGRDTFKAADNGSAVHDVFERVADGEAITEEDLHPDLVPYLRHFRDFLEEFQPSFRFQEETVWSAKHLYAGSFDALAEIEGHLVWVDYKTTRSGVHAEVALQLAAYAHADFILRPDGSKVPLPKADQAAVLHVRPEGWSLVPVRIDQEVFDHFLHLRQTFEWDRDVSKTVLGKALNANPTVSKRGQKRATV